MATLSERVLIPQDILFNEVSGEAVLLNQTTGKYYSLDTVGTHIWTLMARLGHLDLVYQALLKEYEVDPRQLEQDLLALADKLADHALLQITAA